MRIPMLKSALAALFLFLLPLAGVQAAEVAGTVLYASGKVTATAADGSRRDLQRRSPVHAGDLLQTGSNARAQLRFTDGSIVALKPGSELRLDDYSYRRDAGGTSVMSLLKGGFRTMTGAISQLNKDNYKVNTPVATIGVRGTLYETSYAEGRGLSLGVWDGGITACNEGGCIDLGMNADHRFGFVPVGGKPEGSREEPPGIGGDDAGAGDNGADDSSLVSLGGGEVVASDLQPAGLFGPASVAGYNKVGYALLGGGGVLSGPARAVVENYDGYYLRSWAIVDSSSGFEVSPGPDYRYCSGECYSYPSWNGGMGTEGANEAEVAWGDWYEHVSIGLSAGDPQPSVAEVAGGFVMADAISPSEVMAWASQNTVLTGSVSRGYAAESGYYLGSSSVIGSIYVDFTSGDVSGDLSVSGSQGYWNLEYSGAVSGGRLTDMTLNAADSVFTANTGQFSSSSVTGHIEADFFGKSGEVVGVVGGLTASTVGANLDTGNVETLDAVFMMSSGYAP